MNTFNAARSFAQQLDSNDPLRDYRDRFYIPTQKNGEPTIYFTGNSLGCQPKTTRDFIEIELEDWAKMGVKGHVHARNPWMPYHEFLSESTAKVVGAKQEEVVVMNALTVNLHLMMVSFYRPKRKRRKILLEADAFPSDIYAASSQIKFHGYNPKRDLILLEPRKGEHTLRTEDILAYLDEHGDEIALVLLGGVNYYTGQAFDFAQITEKGHEKGCIVGFDCAHATGNLALKLHDWGVDFAAWCSYKYLNGGPGAVGGVFVHERHANDFDLPRFAGWWGHDKESRFLMKPEFIPIPGAEGWQHSNANVLSMAALRASMEIFDEVGMDALCKKSELLTGYLEYLIHQLDPNETPIEIITPQDTKQRGCQLSLLAKKDGRQHFERLVDAGVICDWREPEVIRIAPVPLYNTFEDVWKFVDILKK